MTTLNPLNCLSLDDRHTPRWSYAYSPYQRRDGTEIPTFEIYDHHGEKLFDTNEDLPSTHQEAAAQLAVAAPALRAALTECLRLLADFDESRGEEGDVYRHGVLVLALCPVPMRTEGT